MLPTSGTIYQYIWSVKEASKAHPALQGHPLQMPSQRPVSTWPRRLGIALVAIALGGVSGPVVTKARLEGSFYAREISQTLSAKANTLPPLPPAAPVVFTPLATPDGASIEPINRQFSLVVPKAGINAAVVASVDPGNLGSYTEALKTGIAHASTSFLPDQNGTVYLFSHSTNFDWFVRDLNAVFYLLKNLDKGDLVVLFYKGRQYTYKITDKAIVQPREISYLVPQAQKKQLILQTCWPPGSTAERLLIFADLVEEQGQST